MIYCGKCKNPVRKVVQWVDPNNPMARLLRVTCHGEEEVISNDQMCERPYLIAFQQAAQEQGASIPEGIDWSVK